MLRSIYEFLGQIDHVSHLFNPRTWAISSGLVGANTQATVTKAAQAKTGKRNVATSITVTLAAGSSAPTATVLSVALIDGASGGTSYLWGPHYISIPAVAGSMNGMTLPCWIVGSPNTAMTLEFSGAAGANTFESVTLEGTYV